MMLDFALIPLIFIFIYSFFYWYNIEFNYKNFYIYIDKYGSLLFYRLPMSILGIAYYIDLFLNHICKNVINDTLYLKSIRYGYFLFVNEKNDIYNYKIDVENIETEFKDYQVNGINYSVGKYYDVKRIRGTIQSIIGESNNKFPLSKKVKYWTNCYLPDYEFEDMLILPLLYIFAFPSLVGLIMAPGFQKIICLAFGIVPIYLIIYDYIYKNKINK